MAEEGVTSELISVGNRKVYREFAGFVYLVEVHQLGIDRFIDEIPTKS